MKKLQKIGGIAALYEAGAYLLGFGLWIGVLGYSSDLIPAQKVASFVKNLNLWYFLNLVVYIVGGLSLGVLALALNDRLKTGSPAITLALWLVWWASSQQSRLSASWPVFLD